MKLLQQVLEELGADTLKSFTIVPAFGGYFSSIKAVLEYSDQKVVLRGKKFTVTLEGEKFEVGSYFQEDIFIKGDIKVIKID